MVWTVNEPEHMMEVSGRCLAFWSSIIDCLVKCVRWGADVILTDVTKKWLDLREALRGMAHDVFPRLVLMSTILSQL
jgi:phosphatidylglycerol phospholipase C